jgi:hypothetical protein
VAARDLLEIDDVLERVVHDVERKEVAGIFLPVRSLNETREIGVIDTIPNRLRTRPVFVRYSLLKRRV